MGRWEDGKTGRWEDGKMGGMEVGYKMERDSPRIGVRTEY